MRLPAILPAAPPPASDPPLYARIALEGSLYGAPVRFTGEMGDGWKLAASIERVSVSQVLADLCDGESLPLFEGVTVSLGAVLASAERRFALHADVRDLPPVPFDPGASFRITRFTLDAVVVAGRVESLALSASGTITLGEGARIELRDTRFTWEPEARRWTIGTGVELHLLDGVQALALEYRSDPQGRHLAASFIATPPVRLLDLGFARLQVERLAFTLDQPAGGARTRWMLEATAAVEVDDVCRLAGTLHVTDHSVELVDVEPLRLPFTVGDRTVTFEAALARLGARREERGWSLVAETTLALRNLPDGVRQVLPEPLQISLFMGRRDGGARLELSLRSVVQALFVPQDIVVRDPASGDERRIPLSRFGQVGFALTGFGVVIGPEGIAVTAETGLGLPYALNGIFGTDAEGNPTHPVLRTLPPPPQVPGKESYCEVRWCLSRGRSGNGAGTRFSFKPVNSLFPEHLEVTDDRWNIDLGTAGRVWVALPELSFDAEGGRFSCNVSAGRGENLAIPLDLLRAVLHRTFPGHEAQVDRVVPASIPVSDIKAFRDGRLQVEPLLDYVGGFVHDAAVLTALRDAAEKVASAADQLPDALKPYLAFTVPKEFSVSLSLRPSSSEVSIGIEVKGARPGEGVRMLLPVPSGVCLYGINFRGFSFAPMLAGRLFRLELDLDVDTFNLPLIAAGMLLPSGGALVPAVRQHDRATLQKLVVLIVIVQAGPAPVPVPVPVFYEKLGWDHLDLFDFEAGVQAEFYPRPDLFGMLKLLYRLYDFVRDPDTVLRTDDLSEDMRLSFRVGKPALLRLPAYLGRDLALGTRDGYVVDVSPLDLLARVLNTLKHTRVNEVVQLLPLEKRTFVIGGTAPGGEAVPPLTLWGLTLRGGAVLATPAEFVQRAYTVVGYANAAEARDALALSPARVKEDQQGVVVMARGQVDGTALRLRGEYALASVEGRSFETGVRFAGEVPLSGGAADALQLGVTACLVASSDQRDFHAAAKAFLRVLGMDVFTAQARAEVQPDALRIQGNLQLFPGGAGVSVKASTLATVTAARGVDIDARVSVVTLGFIPAAAGSFTLHGGEMRLRTSWWGSDIEYQVSVGRDVLTTSVTAAIPVISLQSWWTYTVASRTLRGSMRGAIPGGSGFAASLTVDGTGANGDCAVTLLNVELVSGRIWLDPARSAYGVSGSYRVFPPNPVLNFAVGGSGGLSRDGLQLAFGGSTGFLGLVELRADAWVDWRGAGTALRASSWVGEVSVASGLFRFPAPDGPVSFLMRWKLAALLPTTYAAAGPGGVNFWLWNAPPGWPMAEAVEAVEPATSAEGPDHWESGDFWRFVERPMVAQTVRADAATGDDEARDAWMRRYLMLGDLRAHGAYGVRDGVRVERVHVHRPAPSAAADPFAEVVQAAQGEIRRRTRARPLLRRAALARAATLHAMVVEHAGVSPAVGSAVVELVGGDYTLRVPQARRPGAEVEGVALGRFLVNDTRRGPAWRSAAVALGVIAAAAAAAAAWWLLG